MVLVFKAKLGSVGLSSIFYTWWDTMAVFYRMHILKYYDKDEKK